MPTPCHDTARLQTAVFDMDCLSQSACSEISAIARLALVALETPDGYKHLEAIAQALTAIRNKADETQGFATSVAEELGCDSKDASIERRHIAMMESSHV